MNDIMNVIQEADTAALIMEKAREGVELAKLALENAKEHFENTRLAFEQSLAKGDEIGLPRAKIKKLIEERTQSLVASGLLPLNEEKPRLPKPPRTTRKSKSTTDSESDVFSDDALLGKSASEVEVNADSAFAMN